MIFVTNQLQIHEMGVNLKPFKHVSVNEEFFSSQDNNQPNNRNNNLSDKGCKRCSLNSHPKTTTNKVSNTISPLPVIRSAKYTFSDIRMKSFNTNVNPCPLA